MSGVARLFRQKIKGLAEGGDHLPILPSSMRWHGIQKPRLPARRLVLEQDLRVPSQLQNLQTLFHAGVLGFLAALDDPL